MSDQIAHLTSILDVVMPHLVAEYRAGGGSPEFRKAVEAAAALTISRKVQKAVEPTPPDPEGMIFLKRSRRPTVKNPVGKL